MSPKTHHLGPHHHPPHHRWLVNFEGPVTSKQAGDLLARIGAGIVSEGQVVLGNERIDIPENLRIIVRHEVMPRGELVAKVELMWEGPSDAAGHSIEELIT